MPSYRRLQQYAIAISILSVLYNGAEGAISIGLGSESSSRSLIFFGIQSGIEVASALVVLWRFRRVAKLGEEGAIVLSDGQLRVERVGTWSIGILIAILALATEITAIIGLVKHEEPDSSNASLIISASALVIMVLIWAPKRTLARLLNSSTMEGEATCSLSCIQITIVLFVGSLVFRLWRGGWWVDSATSLVLGILFAREAWKMLAWVRNPNFNGGCCGECGTGNFPKIDKDAELVEQYRDLCECCDEKEECRTGNVCKCEEGQVDVSAVKENTCCVPKTPTGKACCTRELIQGPRPQRPVRSSETCCQEEHEEEEEEEQVPVHNNPNPDSDKRDNVDRCCSSSKKNRNVVETRDRAPCCQEVDAGAEANSEQAEQATSSSAIISTAHQEKSRSENRQILGESDRKSEKFS